MYHRTNLGAFDGDAKKYADLRGYVPEAGDHWSKMQWDAQTEWDADSWQEHVEGAVRATEQAEKAVAEWQRQNG